MTSVPQTKPPPGFMPWVDIYWGTQFARRFDPERNGRVEIWRMWQTGPPEEMNITPHGYINLHPATNVSGLYWRPIDHPTPRKGRT